MVQNSESVLLLSQLLLFSIEQKIILAFWLYKYKHLSTTILFFKCLISSQILPSVCYLVYLLTQPLTRRSKGIHQQRNFKNHYPVVLYIYVSYSLYLLPTTAQCCVFNTYGCLKHSHNKWTGKTQKRWKKAQENKTKSPSLTSGIRYFSQFYNKAD